MQRHLRPVLETAAVELLDDGRRGEPAWLQNRVDTFLATQVPFDDQTAARVLLDLQTPGLRDQALLAMTRESAPTHVALWTDLTQRSPEELRGHPASLLAIAACLHGDGARSWVALDLVPDAQRADCGLAQVAAQLNTDAVPPSTWDAFQEAESASRDAPPRASSKSELRSALRPLTPNQARPRFEPRIQDQGPTTPSPDR